MNIQRLHDVTILASPHTALFAADGKHLVCAGSGLWLYDLAGNVVHTFRKPSRYGVWEAWSTRGAVIAKSSSKIRRWDLKTRALEVELEPKALGYHDLVSISPDGKRALTTTYNKAFWLWDLATGALGATMKEKKSVVASAALSADGATIAYGGTDGIVRFFDVASKTVTVRAPSRGWIEIVARSDDGRFFATAGRAGIISIWTRDGALHRALTQGTKITALVFSPDGELLVAHGSHGVPVVWSVEDGERVATIDDHEPKGLLGGTRSVRFSSDGKRIVTTGNDCRVVVSKIG